VPVVRISALPQPGGLEPERALAAVTQALAGLLGEEPSGSWATWEEIPPGRYAEGDDAPALQPPATHPPLVELIAFEGRPPEVVERMLTTVAEVLERELGLERGNVFVRYVEATEGRLYTGGKVVRALHNQ
jgi:phenylpyruvate tautomerase PptA (4-oxalocrotonate tautomerase family)